MKKLILSIVIILIIGCTPLNIQADSGDLVIEGKTINGTLLFDTGTSIDEFSTDGTFAGNSDDAIPTEKAINTYGYTVWDDDQPDDDSEVPDNITVNPINATTEAAIEAAGFVTTTTAAWSKSIGSSGDYATFTAMMAAMPNLLAHAVTVTIQTGTTLTETCEIKNKHGLTNAGAITVQAEKYYPTASTPPTTDSATATTLRDAELATAAFGNDYFNGCWVFVVDGTGTDNGFVLIVDYVDATGDVVVASWPGVQPDNTSRYIIVGALIDGQNTQEYGFDITNNTCSVFLNGVGVKDIDNIGCWDASNFYTYHTACGFYNCDRCGIHIRSGFSTSVLYCGFVSNNTDSHGNYGGIAVAEGAQGVVIRHNGLSDNNIQGMKIRANSWAYIADNFGDGNGLWGVYANSSGQASIGGTECSGLNGNHSDPGTAGNANADQAAAY